MVVLVSAGNKGLDRGGRRVIEKFGDLERNKARLVAQGHTQEEGIDYEEVFTPVVRIEAKRLFLAYASFMGFMADGFQRGKIDQTLFIKKQKGDILLVQVYVDDIIFGSTNKELCKAFKKLMKDKFQMSSMGELTFFLGLQVKQKDNSIFISQDKYVAEILRKFSLTDGKLASTPIDTKKPLLKNPDGEDMDVHIYRKEALAIPGQTETGKESLNPFMADSLPKTILLTIHGICINMSPFEFSLIYLVVTSMHFLNVVSSKLMLFSRTIDVAHLNAVRRIGKGFSRVDTLLFDGMLVQQQDQDVEDAAEDEDNNNEVSAEPTPPSPIPTRATLTNQVANLEQDKIPQSTEIIKLKQKGQEVGEEETIQIFKIKEIKEDADEDVTLVDAEEDRNADDTDEAAPAEVEVVTAAKLMTEVVTTAATTITVAQMPKASAPRKMRGVVIRDPKETATASVIMYFEVNSKDKGKGILIEEPKPLKRQAQIKQDEAFARQVMRYQALKRKPATEAQGKKNMMIYLKNMAEFKMHFFKGMTYNDIRPIFEKHYNLNQAFLERVKEEVIGQKKEGNKRKGENLNYDAAKK
nr:hypothetical protein [Tanacetum cinerariifolium]